MKPKLNKLITLLLILGTFAFLMEAEERVSSLAQKELSEWASLLPVNSPNQAPDSLEQYSHNTSLFYSFLSEDTKKVNSVNN
ncbi:hypothetical protein [Ekhidna sp. To15]|uniref:hypothetical protein n=1 Tax=Ekhidna sp. To15 TaxID=3395267 RepID=UPI003F527EDB